MLERVRVLWVEGRAMLLGDGAGVEWSVLGVAAAPKHKLIPWLLLQLRIPTFFTCRHGCIEACRQTPRSMTYNTQGFLF